MTAARSLLSGNQLDRDDICAQAADAVGDQGVARREIGQPLFAQSIQAACNGVTGSDRAATAALENSVAADLQIDHEALRSAADTRNNTHELHGSFSPGWHGSTGRGRSDGVNPQEVSSGRAALSSVARATLGALAFAALIFGAIRCTGEPTEAHALQDVAAEVKALAVEAAQLQADLELMVRQHCAAIHGERAQVLRVAGEGHLVCRRRGEVL